MAFEFTKEQLVKLHTFEFDYCRQARWVNNQRFNMQLEPKGLGALDNGKRLDIPGFHRDSVPGTRLSHVHIEEFNEVNQLARVRHARGGEADLYTDEEAKLMSGFANLRELRHKNEFTKLVIDNYDNFKAKMGLTFKDGAEEQQFKQSLQEIYNKREENIKELKGGLVERLNKITPEGVKVKDWKEVLKDPEEAKFEKDIDESRTRFFGKLINGDYKIGSKPAPANMPQPVMNVSQQGEYVIDIGNITVKSNTPLTVNTNDGSEMVSRQQEPEKLDFFSGIGFLIGFCMMAGLLALVGCKVELITEQPRWPEPTYPPDYTPAISEPVKTEPVKPQPVKTEPIKPERVRDEPIKTEPVEKTPKPLPKREKIDMETLEEDALGKSKSKQRETREIEKKKEPILENSKLEKKEKGPTKG